MTVPSSKTELLAQVSTTFDRLMDDLHRVPGERAEEASLEGHARGTRMSPADLVAYLIGWNELVLKWLEQDDLGRTVAFPEAGFKWNELGLLARKFYGDYPQLAWPARLARLTAAKDRLVRTSFTGMPGMANGQRGA